MRDDVVALTTGDTIAYVRERIVERLRERERSAATDSTRLQGELAKVEEKIQRLVRFIAEGTDSRYVRAELDQLEARAGVLQQELAAAQTVRRAPVTLPTTDLIVQRVLDIATALQRDAVAGREALRALLVGGEIRIDRDFVARARVLPLAAFLGTSAAGTQATETKRPPQVSQEAATSEYKTLCGGRI